MTLIQIEHAQISRVPEASGRKPEAYRKLTGRPTCPFLFYVVLQFRNLPEGFQKAYRELTWELLFYVGPGRFPESFWIAARKENNHLIYQKSKCQQSDLGQPVMGPRQG